MINSVGGKPAFSHLWWCWRVSIAGQDFQCDAPAAVSQKLLEFLRIATNLSTVELADDVPRVQHSLPVDGAAMHDPRNNHLSSHDTERDPLEE